MRSVVVEAEDVSSSECPKSILLRNPVLQDLVQIEGQSRIVKSALGKPSQWPGVFFDAITVLRMEHARDSAAQSKAISKLRASSKK